VRRARAVGAGVRLACDLSGRNAELLGRARLRLDTGAVLLEADAAAAPILLGEQTAKRAAAFAHLLGRELTMRPAAAEAEPAA
ncbi:MAG: Ppx/GppA family phosphatase, partial [Caulobacteraceae bacterium]